MKQKLYDIDFKETDSINDATFISSFDDDYQSFGFIDDIKKIETKGGPGSGNFGHVGRPGMVGGSGEGGGSAAARPSNGIRKNNKVVHDKKNMKQLREKYKNDSNFRKAANAIAMYTAGYFIPVRKVSALLRGENDPEAEAISKSLPMKLIMQSKSSITNSLVKDSDVLVNDDKMGEIVAKLNEAIENAEPIGQYLYRGVPESYFAKKAGDIAFGWDGKTLPKIGDTLHAAGVTSFTKDKEIAQAFSLGLADGQSEMAKYFVNGGILFEVKKGCKALDVKDISDWKQSEMLTFGTFKVTHVDQKEIPNPDDPMWGDPRYITTIGLEQISTDYKPKNKSFFDNREDDFVKQTFACPLTTFDGIKEYSVKGLSRFFKGGPGSGNFGHVGRPGAVGGSGGSNFIGINISPSPSMSHGSIDKMSDKRLNKCISNTDKMYKFIKGSPEGNKRASQKILYNKLKNNKAFYDFAEKLYMDNGVYSKRALDQMIKDGDVSKKEILKEGIRDLIDNWAITSGDGDNLPSFMQHCAAKEFKLKGYEDKHLAKGYKRYSKYEDGAKEFLREQYKLTQKQFRSRGIRGELIGYRGVETFSKSTQKIRDEAFYTNIKTSLQPLSSFSAEYDTALQFGDYTTACRIPTKSILSTPLSGYGCTEEKEMIVLGGKAKIMIDSGRNDTVRMYLRGRTKSKVKGVPDKIDTLIEIECIDSDIRNADWVKKTRDVTKEDYITKGGHGSGNFGHVGRPGMIGGSGEGGSGGAAARPKLTGLAEKYTNIGGTEARIVEDLFVTDVDREARIANEFNLDTVTTIMADDAAKQIKDFTQWYLLNVRKLPETLTVYRSGKINNRVVGVTLDRNVAERNSKRNGYPVQEYNIPRKLVLADIEAIRPLGYQESEILVYSTDLNSSSKKSIKGLSKFFKVTKEEAFDFSGWFFENEEWNKRLAEEGGMFIKELYDTFGRAAFDGLKKTVAGVTGTFSMEYPYIEEFLNNYVFKFAEAINKTTASRLEKMMSMIIDRGLSMEDAANYIDEIFDNPIRSLLIARTETIRASNYGTVEAYKQSGVVTGKRWLVTEDDRTCDRCLEMVGKKSLTLNGTESLEGKSIGLNEPFFIDPNGYSDGMGPPLHPNCRCTILAEIDEEYLKAIKGGPGSGNFGHVGRPGMVGGSGEGGGSAGAKPSEKLVDITDKFQVSKEDLERFNSLVKVGQYDVLIGRGTGYYPREGGQAEMFDNRIVSGPKKWIGKNAWEIPEVAKAVDKAWNQTIDFSKSGDFSKAKSTTDQDIVATMLSQYKSPLMTIPGGKRLSSMVESYYKNGKLKSETFRSSTKSVMEDYEEAQQYNIKHPETHILEFDSYKNIDKSIFNAKLDDIRNGVFETKMHSQDAINQFYSEIQRTQKVLMEKYPTGKVTLYRGVNGDYAKNLKNALKKNKDVQISLNNASSWTSNKNIASTFSGKKGVVLSNTFDVKDVLFSYHSSPYIRMDEYPFGGTQEYEYIIGSKTGKMKINASNIKSIRNIIPLPNIDDDIDNKFWLKIKDLNVVSKGGPGSGNFGHVGRPGMIGGSGEGGGSAAERPSTSSSVGVINKLTEKQYKKLNQDIEKNWSESESARSMMAWNALVEMKDKGMAGVVLKDNIGIKGIASLRDDDIGIYVSSLATREKGVGEKMIKEICKVAVKENKGIYLLSATSAVGFYKEIGMTKKSGNWFSFSWGQAKRYLGANVKKKSIEDYEPENGVFTIPTDVIPKGGPGSGNFGHVGRPGMVGGSVEGGGSAAAPKKRKDGYYSCGWKKDCYSNALKFGKEVNKEPNKYLNSKSTDAYESHHAINEYVNYENQSINNTLRHGKISLEGMLNIQVANSINGLDNLMKHCSVPKPVIVARGIDEDVYKMLKRKSGKTFIDKGFVSTTLAPKVLYPIKEEDTPFPNVIEIKVPKGTRAFFVETKYRPGKREYELLIDRGYKYKVNNDGYGNLTLEVI
jgi:hypothetical protein